jgi:hypothetical protein
MLDDEFMDSRPSERLREAARVLAAETGTPPSLTIGVDPAGLTNDLLGKLYSYWQSLRCQGRPSYRELDPLDLKFALGNIMLAEPIAEGADFRYRIGATVATTSLGVELTGRKVSECFAPVSRTFYLASYREVHERVCTLYSFHVPPRPVPLESWERLMLPLFDDAGDVARILTGVVPGSYRSPDNGS